MITRQTNHKSTIDAHRVAITRWYAKGASNDEVAKRLCISVAALHRHTRHWGIKKIPKHRVYKKTKKFEPCSNKIKHLAVNAKWTKAAL